MLNSHTSFNLNDVCFAQKVIHALKTEGFFVLEDVRFPFGDDFVSYAKSHFSDVHYSLGGKGGRMCYFSRKDEPTKPVFEYLEKISMDVLKPLGFADRIVNSEHSCIQLTRYPKNAEHEIGETLVSDHTDPSFVTVITSSSNNGFFVQGHLSGWTEVNLSPTRVAVFVSDTLQKLTKSEYKAVLHKVSNTFPESERFSCQIFPFAADGYNVRNYHQEGYPNE